MVTCLSARKKPLGLRDIALYSLTTLLVACGGGGGGGSGDDGPPPAPSNRAPALGAMAFTTNEDVQLVSQVAASDADGDALTYILTSNPDKGTLSFGPSGSFTYRPDADFSGADSFGVQVADAKGGSVTGTVAITVTAVNDAPRGAGTAFSTQEDTVASGDVTATDPEGDAITFTKAGDGAKGTVAVDASGTFTYTPLENASGTDSFEIEVRDATNAASRLAVSVTIEPVNDAPRVQNDFLRVAGGSTVVLDVLANDVDPDGESLTLAVIPETLYFAQSATAASDRIEVTMLPDFVGFGRVDYTVTDGAGLVATATAVFFVDTQPFRVVYETNEENGKFNAYVHDLISARRVSHFDDTTSPLYLGRTAVSANGSRILYEGGGSTPNGNYLTREIWVAPVDGSAPARRITPELQNGQTLNPRSKISPDGQWLVFGITTSNVESLYLADLRPSGGTTPIPLPAGATRIESDYEGMIFGPTSQFVYYTATFPFGGQRGQATYRFAVNDPASPALRLSDAAAVNRFGSIVAVSPDESRVLQSTFSGSTMLDRIETAQPGTRTTLSHPLAAGENFFDILTDAAFTRVSYGVQRPGSPFTYALYVAEIGQQGSGALVADLVTEGTPPHVTAMHPSGDAVLYLTRAGGGQEQINELALTPGATALPMAYRSNDLPLVRYIGDGRYVAYKGPAGFVEAKERGDQYYGRTISTRQSGIHTYSPDTNVIAVLGAPLTAGQFHLFLTNRGTFREMQLTGEKNPASETTWVELAARE